jgi:hypothetical protein
MIALIPVSKFRVPYELASGRPYSGLEKAVLAAVGESGATLVSLKNDFRMHERLLVEAAVTLVTAGWVAVVGGPETQFSLTAAGKAALDADHDPVSVTVRAANPQIIVMERITGQVARHADARSWNKRDLADVTQNAVMLRERIFRNSLDEAQVQKLLPRGVGEWVRRIGPIAQVSRQTHFVPVDVDVESGVIQGLSHSWQGSLAPHVSQAVRDRAMKSSDVPIIVDMPRQRSRRPSSAFSSIPQIASETARRTTAFNMRRGDLVVGPIDHGRALADAIATARTSVGLVSPVADDETLRRVADMAGDAIRRGVHVDLLFGALPPDEDAGTLVSTANEIGYRIDKMSGRNRLRTRHLPTGSGASVLIFDDPSSRLVALIGDHQWLSSNNSGIPAIGLTVTQQSICADVARAVSSLWLGRETQDHRWAALGERWNTLATAAEDQAAATEAVLQAGHQTYGSEAELLVDDEISSLDAETPPTARVGGGVADTSGGEGALRGLVLRITGEGATLIAQARAL